MARNAKRRKPPVPRPMLCTDIQVNSGAPEDAFVTAYNWVMENANDHMSMLREQIAEGNALKRHRAKELMELLKIGGKLDQFDYPLSLRLLDRFEVTPEGRILVIFHVGISVLI